MVNSFQFIKDSDKRNMFSTSKINKNDHGLGLKSIHTIIDKYNGNLCSKHIGSFISNRTNQHFTNLQFFYNHKY